MRTVPIEVVRAAQLAQAHYQVPASVSIAQWAIESAWGSHSPGNNCFGIKAIDGYGTQTFMTHEVIRGVREEVPQKFCRFDTLDEAFTVHAKLLSESLTYKAAMLALPDREKFIKLMAPHYATDPLYATKLTGIIASNGLAKYDAAPGR